MWEADFSPTGLEFWRLCPWHRTGPQGREVGGGDSTLGAAPKGGCRELKAGREGWAGKCAVWEREPCLFCRLRRTHLWSKAVKFSCHFPSPSSCPCPFSDLVRFIWNLTQSHSWIFLKKFCDTKSSAEMYLAHSMDFLKKLRTITSLNILTAKYCRYEHNSPRPAK
jgi:hypothetical protein